MTKMTPRERFDRWLRQRGLDLQCRSAEGNEIPDPEEDATFAAFELAGRQLAEEGSLMAYSPLPTQVGEIRLLDPSLTPGNHNTWFVTIIEMKDGIVTLVPFSPYLDAASLFETNLIHPAANCFNALQIWNLRRLPVEVLKKSWLVGQLHTEDLNIALGVAKASFMSTAPDVKLREHCGTSIQHLLDPRRQYLEEMADIMDMIQAEGWTLLNK